MHYTSWDRSDRDNPKLLANGGPEVIGTFHKDSAEVAGQKWALTAEEKTGATITTADNRVFRIDGDLRRGKDLTATIEGRTFRFVNEQGANWIIDDEQGNKVGQFTGTNSGVRTAVLEFEEPDTPLPLETAAALSYFVRSILEFRLNNMALAAVVGLALCSLAAIVTFFT